MTPRRRRRRRSLDPFVSTMLRRRHNNTEAQMPDYTHHIKLSKNIFGMKTSSFFHLLHSIIMVATIDFIAWRCVTPRRNVIS